MHTHLHLTLANACHPSMPTAERRRLLWAVARETGRTRWLVQIGLNPAPSYALAMRMLDDYERDDRPHDAGFWVLWGVALALVLGAACWAPLRKKKNSNMRHCEDLLWVAAVIAALAILAFQLYRHHPTEYYGALDRPDCADAPGPRHYAHRYMRRSTTPSATALAPPTMAVAALPYWQTAAAPHPRVISQ